MKKAAKRLECVVVATGIRPNTIGDLSREDVKKIDIQTLNKLCKVFNCEIGELLEYVPDNDEIEV